MGGSWGLICSYLHHVPGQVGTGLNEAGDAYLAGVKTEVVRVFPNPRSETCDPGPDTQASILDTRDPRPEARSQVFDAVFCEAAEVAAKGEDGDNT